MPKRIPPKDPTLEPFGKRLARLRQAAGLYQNELAKAVGVSPRMIAHYETEGGNPPLHLLPIIAKSLNVAADELLGITDKKKKYQVRDSRLWRKFRQAEKLPRGEKSLITHTIDTVLKAYEIRQKEKKREK